MAFFRQLLQRYREASKARPLAVAFVTCYGKGSASDLVAQMVVERMVTADLVFHVPFMYLPLYYMFEDTALGVGNPFSGLQRWWNELPGTMAAYAKIFPMFHLFNFTVTPPELRISLIACVSFVWLVVLSYISHDAEINELDCVKFHVAGIPTAWKVFYYFFVVLPKFGLWLAVAKSGVHYLMETAGIVDMIVNAMALTFVLEVDEMVFHRFTTSLTKHIMKHIMNNIQDLPNFDTNMEDSETDQQALERFKAEEFGTKGWGKLLMCIPWRLIFVLVLQALFVYSGRPVQQKGTGRPLTSPPTDREEETLGRSGSDREDGSWVSKELRLPKVLAYRPIELMFGLLSTDGDPVWKMPSD
eukprot:g24946.t1